jgi:hypothetical protein
MAWEEALKDAVTPGIVKNVNNALTTAAAKVPKVNDPQAMYEARERAMNANNPYYKNVDNSGFTKEPIGK